MKNIITMNDLTQEQKEVMLKHLKTLKENNIPDNDIKERLKQIGLALYNNVNIDKINDISLSAQQMYQIRLGEQQGLNTDIYHSFEPDKMFEIRYGMICGKNDGRDMSKYLDFTTEQLIEINNGYDDKLNEEKINWYANENYSPQIMKTLRTLIAFGELENISDIKISANLTEEENLAIINDFMCKHDTIKDVDVEITQEKEILNQEVINDNIEDEINLLGGDNLDDTLQQASEEVESEFENIDLGALEDFFAIEL